MSESPWLIEETAPIGPQEAAELDRLGAAARERIHPHDGAEPSAIAVRLQDLVIHDNRKWFGEAELRLDALVVCGQDKAGAPDAFYMPQTYRFSRVADGDRLPTGESGLLAFMGRPAYFLDLFIMVSRDRRDSADLSSLLAGQLGTDTMQGALASLLGLTLSVPQAATIATAVGGAAAVGNLAYRALAGVAGATVGLYHSSWLAVLDDFGVGRHPREGAYREKDLSFWFEVVRDEPALTPP